MKKFTKALIDKKATQLRDACLQSGMTRSPDNRPFKELPNDRKAPWRALAAVYIQLFYSRFMEN